jgi:hypothetical protein
MDISGKIARLGVESALLQWLTMLTGAGQGGSAC